MRPVRPVPAIVRGSITSLLVVSIAACGPAEKPPAPAEVAIKDFNPPDPHFVNGTTPDKFAADASKSAPSTAAASGGDDDSTPAGASASSLVPDSGGDKTETASGPATKLDAKNGFAGVTFGSPRKGMHGLHETEKKGDRLVFRAPHTSYAGVAIKDVSYTFTKNKLSGITFALRSLPECKTVKEALERELGAPQATAHDAHVWKGDRVGLHLAIGTGGCTANVVSKDMAPAGDWSAVESP